MSYYLSHDYTVNPFKENLNRIQNFDREIRRLEDLQNNFSQNGDVQDWWLKAQDNIQDNGPYVEAHLLREKDLIDTIVKIDSLIGEGLGLDKSSSNNPAAQTLKQQYAILRQRFVDFTNSSRSKDAHAIGNLAGKIAVYAKWFDDMSCYKINTTPSRSNFNMAKKNVQTLKELAFGINATHYTHHLSSHQLEILSLDHNIEELEGTYTDEAFITILNVVQIAHNEGRQLTPNEKEGCQKLLQELSPTTYRQIGSKVWELAGGTTVDTKNDLHWGQNHAFDDAHRALEALKGTTLFEKVQRNSHFVDVASTMRFRFNHFFGKTSKSASNSNNNSSSFIGNAHVETENNDKFNKLLQNSFNEQRNNQNTALHQSAEEVQSERSSEETKSNSSEEIQPDQFEEIVTKTIDISEELNALDINLDREDLLTNLQVERVKHQSDNTKMDLEDITCGHLYFYHLHKKLPNVEGVPGYGTKTLYAETTSLEDIRECVRRTRIDLILKTLNDAVEAEDLEAIRKYYNLLETENPEVAQTLRGCIYSICVKQFANQTPPPGIKLKHWNFGKAGFCHEDGCETSKEMKLEALRQTIGSLNKMRGYK